MSATFTHRVLPYDGVDEFLAGAVPFLGEGLAAGDRVQVVCGLGLEVLLRDALGDDAGAIRFSDAARWYAHPSRTLADCLSDAEELDGEGRRLRLLGEPVWARRRPLEVLEWQRVEAILNIAFRGTGAAIMCPYAATLPPGVVAAGRRTHPETVRGARAVPNPGYIDPGAFSARCDREPLPPPPAHADELKIDRPDLYWLRAYVAEYARRTPLPDEDLQRLLVAVTEVVTNAERHGAPPLMLRMWTDAAEDARGDPAFVCEVSDGGRWSAGAGFGLVPPRRSEAGACGRFGLWAVRLLCSLVQIRTGPAGTVVRLRLTLPGPLSDPVPGFRPGPGDGG
ncbi:sensor histidine kinase [Actinomadura sp. WAC 06369]|uniref:sensor histidine kinase n=1 Tax=Actinomadura sp. WAC 06369 TaxID=2203193 RepID=UPI000F7AA5D1|nr:sensor histidine kinase [Actinomadura sp. WAC 06369]RSN57699.1 sensor histidine kinase [Actinomadura sp. WAC 06369]